MQGVKKKLIRKRPMKRIVTAAMESKEPEHKTVFSVLIRTGSDDGFTPKRKPKPTKHRPGSLEKACVLRARLESGQELWHPKDERVLATHAQQQLLSKAASKRYEYPEKREMMNEIMEEVRA